MAGTPDKMELARGALDEFYGRDHQSTDFFADDLVFDFSGFRGWIEEKEYVGRAAFDAQMARWTGPFETWTMEVTHLVDAGGDDVLGVGIQRGVMKGSGAVVEMPLGQIWTVRDGKLVRIRLFADDRDAYAAAGIEPPG